MNVNGHIIEQPYIMNFIKFKHNNMEQSIPVS